MVARNCGILICEWMFLFRVGNCVANGDWFLEPNRFKDHELLRNLFIGDGFGDDDLAKNRPIPHPFWEMSAKKLFCSKNRIASVAKSPSWSQFICVLFAGALLKPLGHRTHVRVYSLGAAISTALDRILTA
uniref:Putative secreted protein n=1 Tax=Ixodes ricinus TaxID=34613 RepID=A0A6B0UR85_IXORI